MSCRPLIFSLVLAGALFVTAYQVQQPIMLEMEAPESEKFLDNFFGPERDARWTQAHSAVWLSGLGGGNLAWRAGMRLSGARSKGVAAPHVVVHANGATLADINAPNDVRDYEWQIAPWQLGANGDLLLEVESDTFTPPSDPRALGVRVTRVWLTRGDGLALPPAKTLALLVLLAGLGAMGADSVGAWRETPAEDEGRRTEDGRSARSRPKSVVGLRSCVAAAIWLAGCAALALNHAESAWWLALVALCALFVAGLAWLLARVVSITQLTRREALGVLALLALGAAVRLALDLGRGYEGDVAIYLSLAWKTAHYGIASAYLNVSGVPAPNTPPLLLYPFWLLGWLYQQLFAPLFAPTWLSDPDLLRFMLRMPSLAAELLSGAVIFRVLRGEGVVYSLRVLAVGAYLFNPALIFDAAYWGQTAAIHTLFMLLAVVATERRAYGWAGAALAAGVLAKPQALAIVPLVVLLAWRERGVLRLSAGGLIAAALILAPFIANGSVGAVLAQYTRTTEFHPYIAVNAHNFWWLVTGGQGWQPDEQPLGLLSFRVVGLLLFACATLQSAVLLWRERRLLFMAAAYQSLAFFMLNTQIHENHLLPMFAPLLLAAATDTSLWWLYGAFTLTALANMALHDPNLVSRLGYPAEDIYGGPGLALPRWLNAAAQTALFVVFTLRFSGLLRGLRLSGRSMVRPYGGRSGSQRLQ